MVFLKRIRIIGILKGLYFHIPIFTLYFLGEGVGLPQVILSEVFFTTVSFLSELPTGIFADKFGQKTSMAIGYLFDAIGFLIMLLLPNVVGLYVGYSIRGLAESFMSGSEESYIYEAVKERAHKGVSYQKEFAAFRANKLMGFLIASLVTGGIIQIFGTDSYSPIFLLTITALFVAFILTMSLPKLKNIELIPEEGKGVFTALKKSLLLVKTDKVIFALTIVAILTLNGEFSLRQMYQPVFEELNVAPFLLGLSLSLGSLLNFLLMKKAYVLEQFFTLPKILLYINLFLGLLYILFSQVKDPYIIVLLFILLQGIFNVQSPIVSDYINERISSDIRSTVLSAISFARNFFEIIQRFIIAVAIGIFSLQGALFLVGLLLIVGILIGYRILILCGCVQKITLPYSK